MNKKWIFGVVLVLVFLGFFFGNCSNEELTMFRKAFRRASVSITVSGVPTNVVTIAVSTVGELETALSNAISNIGNPSSGTDTNIVSIPEAIGTIVAHPELVSQLPSSVDLGPLFNEGGGLAEFDKLTQGKTPEQIRDTWGNSVQVAFSSNIFKGMRLSGNITWVGGGTLPFVNEGVTNGASTLTLRFDGNGKLLPGLYMDNTYGKLSSIPNAGGLTNTYEKIALLVQRYDIYWKNNANFSNTNNIDFFAEDDGLKIGVNSEYVSSSIPSSIFSAMIHSGPFGNRVISLKKMRIFANRNHGFVSFLIQMGDRDFVSDLRTVYTGFLIEGVAGEKAYVSGDHSILPDKNKGESGFYDLMNEYLGKARQTPQMKFDLTSDFPSSPLIFTEHYNKRP